MTNLKEQIRAVREALKIKKMQSASMVGERLREAREAANLTQQSVSRILGVTRPQVANIELGNCGVRTNTLILLCTLYEVSSDYILGLSDETTNNSSEE